MIVLDNEIKSFNLKDDRFIHNLFDDLKNPKKKYILNVITKHVLNKAMNEITLLSALQVPEIKDGKYYTLDILYQLEDGSYLNIEMQQNYNPKKDKPRFQQYGHTMASGHIRKGGDYQKDVRPCYQIILVNKLDKKHPKLIQCAKTYVDKDEDDQDCLIRYYIQLPYIKEILKYKSLEELNNFELLVYLFYFGFTYDILRLDREVVKVMAMIVDEYTRELAKKLGDLKRDWILAQERQEREEELAKTRQEGEEIGQLKNAKLNCIQLFKKSYPNNDDSFLNNLTLSQYKLIFKALLEDQTLDQIQSLLHTYTKNS